MDTEYLKKHLGVVISQDNQIISKVPVEDPFHTTSVTISYTWWEWFKMLFNNRTTKIQVKVQADGVAIGRWMQGAIICQKCKVNRLDNPAYAKTGKLGYENNGERWCESCHYGSDQAIQLKVVTDQTFGD